MFGCSTCDGYEFIPNPDDPTGEKLDCPDCRAIDARPKRWCPVHSRRVEIDGTCLRCRGEALGAITLIEARAASRRITEAVAA